MSNQTNTLPKKAVESKIDQAAKAVANIARPEATPNFPAGGNLAAALAQFQSEIPVPEKDAENPHFKSQFASLESITPIITKRLSEFGLAWTAGAGYQEGQYGVVGRLIHVSGESVEGFFPVTATKPQEVGSAFSYARRYLLLSLTGVAPAGMDDDGNAAQQGAEQQQMSQAQAAQVQAAQSEAAATLNDLKKSVVKRLVERGDLAADADKDATAAKVKELGDAYFAPRGGWENAAPALKKWVEDEAYWTGANPETGEVQ